MLSKEAIMEYQVIYKKVYGEEISYKEAMEKGSQLLRLFQLIYQPIPKDWLKRLKEGGEHQNDKTI